MKLSLAKHLLFVEPEGGALGALGPRLLELGLVTLHATTVEAAERIVGSTGLLSLVAIDDTVGLEAGAELLAAIKREHADLPVVWISSRPATAPLSRSEFMPDAILHHPVDVETLRADVDRLLMEQLYPPALVQLLADSCCEVMFAAYGVTPTVKDRHIRANRNALGTVNAILPFCGRHIAGRVVVGAEEPVLLAIRATTLPHATGSLLAAEDLAGELANLVAGRMKSHFAGFHFDFELGTPIFVTGPQIAVRYRASRPALVLGLEVPGGSATASTLSVSFCFDTFDPSRIVPGQEDATATAQLGELQFL